MKKHGAHYRAGAIDPWAHNRIVARRKTYRRIARQTPRTTRGFRLLAASAERAAESLRDVGRVLEKLGRAS